MPVIIAVVIVGALFILYAIGRSSGKADERADDMLAEIEREQADAAAWERLTR